ncbi:MAG: 50S ribosomal protein L31 [Chloroflexi bacterium]|nr:50S ribosomal protein L31 [Chloroflexota bacterium]
MKEKIHPRWQETTVTCACGNTFTTYSTVKDLRVESCSNCHPFYTGRQKSVALEGRVERYHQRLQKKAEKESEKTAKTKKKKQEATAGA